MKDRHNFQEGPPWKEGSTRFYKVSIEKFLSVIWIFFSLKLLSTVPLYTAPPPTHTQKEVFQIFINWDCKEIKYLVQRKATLLQPEELETPPNKKVEDVK